MSCAIAIDAVYTGAMLPGFAVEIFIATAAFLLIRGGARALRGALTAAALDS